MPWKVPSVSEVRAEFVAMAQAEGLPFRTLCARFGITTPTGYKWLRRYAAEGAAGLIDRARRPHHSPGQTPAAVEAAVLALRAQYPVWGARKLRVLLARQGVQPLPATSTITAILRRHGALDPAQGAGQPRAFQTFEHPYPNALWQMDFKAPLRCGPGRCHPLTVLDDHSRYALVLAACPNQRTGTVRAHLETAFRHDGLPDRFLVDNGSPWGDTWPAGYTPLTVWLRRYGVAVSHSRPYHPQPLGKDERFHGTLQRELLAQPPRPRPGSLANRLRGLAAPLQPRAAPPELGRRRARQPLSPQLAVLPRPAAAPALRPRRSGPQGPGRWPGVLSRVPAPPAQGSAWLCGGLPPHRHRRLLGRGLHDQAPAHPRSA